MLTGAAYAGRHTVAAASRMQASIRRPTYLLSKPREGLWGAHAAQKSRRTSALHVTNGTGGVDEQVYSTTPDTSFRWDPTAQQWVYNQSTKNLLSGITYTYRIYLNDGSSIQYTFGMK